MSANEIWVNNDGLEVRFGSEQGADALGGHVQSYGEFLETVLDIVGTNVPTADAPVDKKIMIPPGAYIESATFFVDTAFTSGGSATLDLGLMNDDGDGTYSTLDDNGIDVALAVAALAADARVACNGAQINTSPANSTNAALPTVFSYGFNTAAFTAGRGRLVVKWRPAVT